MITSTLPFKRFNFPVGEPQVQLGIKPPMDVNVTWEFESASEVIELLVLVDALVRQGHRLHKLILPYMPFSRQDRVMNPGESLAVNVMADVVNACRFKYVVVTDPHSDVTPALLNNCVVIEQYEVFKQYFPIAFGNTCLVSPDGGALKKIYKLAKVTGLEVLECSKRRDVKTGEIKGVTIPITVKKGSTCVIVDDICDGGKTFTELAKELHAFGATRIILMVTHGFFTKGLQVFDGLIDEIYTRKGRVK